MSIVNSVPGGSLMTLCLPKSGAAQYIIFAVANF